MDVTVGVFRPRRRPPPGKPLDPRRHYQDRHAGLDELALAMTWLRPDYLELPKDCVMFYPACVRLQDGGFFATRYWLNAQTAMRIRQLRKVYLDDEETCEQWTQTSSIASAQA